MSWSSKAIEQDKKQKEEGSIYIKVEPDTKVKVAFIDPVPTLVMEENFDKTGKVERMRFDVVKVDDDEPVGGPRFFKANHTFGILLAEENEDEPFTREEVVTIVRRGAKLDTVYSIKRKGETVDLGDMKAVEPKDDD